MSRQTVTVVFVAAVLAGAMWLTMPITRAETGVSVAPPALEHPGRYLIRTSGCNDCHTPGFMQLGEKVPEALWLTGTPIGWRGPWGTTYASNLRLFVKPFSEDDFVKVCHTRNSRPPMPWPSLHAMRDEDLRAIYRYIKSLPEAGQPMPQFVPPTQEPQTPYLSLMPVMPSTQPSNPQASVR